MSAHPRCFHSRIKAAHPDTRLTHQRSRLFRSNCGEKQALKKEKPENHCGTRILQCIFLWVSFSTFASPDSIKSADGRNGFALQKFFASLRIYGALAPLARRPVFQAQHLFRPHRTSEKAVDFCRRSFTISLFMWGQRFTITLQPRVVLMGFTLFV